MKAKHGRMQQKSRTQTSYSADNMLRMSLGNWDMACISKDTQDFCSCVGRAEGSTNSSQFSWKTRVLVPYSFDSGTISHF